MNLVFFDIECANVTKNAAKICAFGYVICDERFNIIKKEDILINPRGKFRLTDRKGDKGIVLPYSYEDFKHYPLFTEVYPYIKSLLEDENNLVFGHSTINDVKYLNLETKRFNLPSFRFRFSDSQLLYMSYKTDFTRQFGLEYIAGALGVEFTPHRAADDAYATMKIVEAMCKARGCGCEELKKDLQMTDGRINDYVIRPPVCNGEKRYHEALRKAKEERAKKRTEYFNYISRKRPARGGLFNGKIFTFSTAIENNLELAKSLADLIYNKGGRYSHRVAQSHYYVTESDDGSQRGNEARKNNLTVTDVTGLKELLNGTAR